MDIEAGLRATSARVRVDAETLRRYAAGVAGLERLAWESTAAALFRARAQDRSDTLARLAARVQELADEVDALALDVRAAATDAER